MKTPRVTIHSRRLATGNDLRRFFDHPFSHKSKINDLRKMTDFLSR